MKFVIELIFVIILLASIWTGYKKGLAAGIATLLSIIISMYVGNLLATSFAPETEKVINPFVDGYMEGSSGIVGEALDEILGDSQDLSVDDAVRQNPDIALELCEKSFSKMGLYSHSANRMAELAVSQYNESTTSGITAAIIDVMSSAIAYFISFTVFFALAIIIFTIILNLINLNLDMPYLKKVNLAGGIVSGALIGIFFCALVAWILKFMGIFIQSENLDGFLIGKLFLKADILSLFLPY